MEKNGAILEMGLHTEWTSNDGQPPVCGHCGKRMTEIRNQLKYPLGMPDYYWHCETPGCKERNAAEEKRLYQEQCAREAQEKREAEARTLKENPGEILKKYNVPTKYFLASLDSFRGGEKYVHACRRFAENPVHSLFFQGNCGCGKTHLAIGILRELFLSGVRSMQFQSVPELLLEIRETFRTDSETTENGILCKYSGPDILVLDDLGAEKSSEFSIATLYLLINRRLTNNKPTIVTSNLTLEEVEEKLDPRIASRFAEYKYVRMNMPDYRKQGAAR